MATSSWESFFFGRVILSGRYADAVHTEAHSNFREYFQGQASTAAAYEERDASNTITGYSNNAFPQNGVADYYTQNYYDDYDFPNNTFGQPVTGQAAAERVKGLLTGSKVKNLGDGAMLLTVNYYDLDGRVVQTKSDNHRAGKDIVDNTYSFIGELTASTRTHTGAANGTPTTIASRYEYDHMGRKIATFENINSQGEVALSHLEYNEIGQLKTKHLHNDMQHTALAYNERGWMTGSASDQFSMKLGYQNGVEGYNGNITTQNWDWANTANPAANIFNYGYDKLNRLNTATKTAGVAMNESLNYDVMGNIWQLSRNGSAFNQYHYSGNRLNSVDNVAGAYGYDANGNAVTDGRNGMGLTYNFLNLPATANGNGTSVAYTYNAAGEKLNKSSLYNGVTTSRDYIAGIEYKNNVIELIHTEEGVAQNNGGNYTYQYNLSDHLGNVRDNFDIYNGSARRLQADDYFAFGKRSSIAPVSENNKYLYNGKELQDELGEQYDYGARFYDPIIGRWNVVDPLAEKDRKTSPYAYAFNNPINVIDPDGMEGQWIPSIANGKLTVTAEKGDNAQTLQKFLNVSQKQADAEFKKMKNGKITLSDDIAGVKAINGAVKDTKDNPDNYATSLLGSILTPDGYNCFESALAISNGQIPTFDKQISGDRFDATVEGKNFTEVTSDSKGLKFGKTVVAFADDQNTHAATFLGTSKNGTKYTWSKDGPRFIPKIETVEELKEDWGKNVRYYNNTTVR